MDANVQEECKLHVLTLAETPNFSRHCHLVPAGQSGPKPTVQIRSSHPATPSVPARPLGSICPDPAIPSTEHPNPPGRSPRWATPRSRPRPELRTLQQAPEGGAVIPSFFTYPGRVGAWGFTRELAAFRNADTLLQIPTTVDAAMFPKQAHCDGTQTSLP